MTDIDALLDRLEREAGAEAAALVAGAEDRAREIRARADAEAERRRAESRALREAESRRAVTRGTAGAVQEGRRTFLAERAALLDRVFDEAEELLRRAPTERYREHLPALVSATLRYLEGRSPVLQCRPELAAQVRTLTGAVAQVEVRAEPDAAAGVQGESRDGAVLVDNTLPALLRGTRARLAIGVIAHLEER